jgi:hypothetical protein
MAAAGRWMWPVLAAVVSACEEPVTVTAAPKPASLVIMATPATPVPVGSSAGTFSVKVSDADGDAVPGALVSFKVTRGGGALTVAIDTSDANGMASTSVTAATFPGLNEVTAFVAGVAGMKVGVTGNAGAPRTVTFSTLRIRYSPVQDSALVTATPRDTFANAAGTSVTWVSRDPAMVSVTPAFTSSAVVRALQRPGSTWIVATSGAAAADSIPVMVTDGSSTPCTFLSTPATLAIGATHPFTGNAACVKSNDPGAEYVLVAHLNTAAYGVAQSISVFGDGVVTPATPFPGIATPASVSEPATDVRDYAFERAMRERESREMAPRLAAARAVLGRSNLKAAPVTAQSHAMPAAATVGQVVTLNVNAEEYCASPDRRPARIAAVSQTAIVLADVDNPPNGFTDDEYRGFAAALDTLVTPVDTTAFGAPTDIDGNKRVGVFFTRAVNELTPLASSSVVLGFFYSRDLLPRQSDFGDCPGSNIGEMFYILVPDPTGMVNSNIRSKTFVSNLVVGTIAHEYQHLINASRRMYETNALRVDEEVWLNEGLSHVAEELVFFRASGLASRANIGIGPLGLGTQARFAFDRYSRANLQRYREYQRFPEGNSPLAGNDGVATRGASWSFLRYLVDRVRPTDGDFWRRLVDARTTGAVSIDSVLAGSGLTTVSALRDWSMSVLADDNPMSAEPAVQQPSWDFFGAMQALPPGQTYGLTPRLLTNQLTTPIGLAGGGSAYVRFGVPQNQEALLTVTTFGGATLPPGIKLSILRIK